MQESKLTTIRTLILSRPLVCFLIVFLCAVTLRVIRFERWPGGQCLTTTVDSNEMSRVAQSLAQRGEFADPYLVPTGPTAHHAPVYPALLALVYRLPQPARIPLRAGLNIVLSSLVCACAFLAGVWLGCGPLVSLASGLLLAAAPARIGVELCNDQEAALTGLAVVLVTATAARWLRGPQRHPLLLGVLWGLALLAVPALLLVCGSFFGIGLLLPQKRQRTAVALLAACVVLLPWTIRNRVVMGGWFFVRDNFGLELRVSNTDGAVVDPSLNAETGAMQQYHPLFNQAAAERVAQYGEVREYARLGRDAETWILENQERFWSLTRERVRNFWIPLGASPVARIRYAASWTMAAIGLYFLFASAPSAAGLLAALLLLYPLPYYLVQSYARYGYPVEWAITLLAVYGFGQLLLHSGLTIPLRFQSRAKVLA